MKIKQHTLTGLWVRDDGAVLMPPCRKFPHFRWTLGSSNNSLGYKAVSYNRKCYYVHRLVAETYIENPNGYATVDHYPDRNPSNNAVTNLRWASTKMQADNRSSTDRCIAKYGVRECEDPYEYNRVYIKSNPKIVEHINANRREKHKNDLDYARKRNAQSREYYAKNKESLRAYAKLKYVNNKEEVCEAARVRREMMKSMGKRERRCPDGKRRYLTDEEFNLLFVKGSI